MRLIRIQLSPTAAQHTVLACRQQSPEPLVQHKYVRALIAVWHRTNELPYRDATVTLLVNHLLRAGHNSDAADERVPAKFAELGRRLQRRQRRIVVGLGG